MSVVPASLRRAAQASLLAPLVSLVAGCGSEAPLLTACDPVGAVTPYCGFSNPEDLVAVAGSHWLLVSEYAEPDESGAIVAFRTADGEQRQLFPDGPDAGLLGSDAPAPGWGDPACPGPPDPEAFEPHGIDAKSPRNESAALAVVNHGRETIDLFEVGYAAGGPALGWRGCVPLPDGVWANDVAFHPDGGLVFTNMLPGPSGFDAVRSGLMMMVGGDTGNLMRWHPSTGVVAIEGSEGSGPNGVAVSEDGREIFFAEWGAGRLVRLRPDGEPRRAEIEVPHLPDNLSWARDGRLLVAGQAARLGDVIGCADVDAGTCGLAYSVVAVDPTSLETEVVFESDGAATGAVSSALDAGGQLYLGTFAGDRIASVRLEP